MSLNLLSSARQKYAAARLFAAWSLALAGAVVGLLTPASADRLDIAKFKLTFEDRFDRMSITAHGPLSTWKAHTPWHGDFGDAQFDDPGPAGPFSLGPEGLRITAALGRDGLWHSGLICSVDEDGPGQHGFTQKFGYFEMRARLPAGPGAWPAFWLIGVDKSINASEVDVLEFYGAFPTKFHNWLHLFSGAHDVLSIDNLVSAASVSLTRDFNTYGVYISHDVTRFYLNRVETFNHPTPAAYMQPMYILADLALGGGWPVRLHAPATMEIAYIRAYSETDGSDLARRLSSQP